MDCHHCRTLCQMNSADCAYVEHFSAQTPAILRLQEQGLIEGCEVEFIRRAPLGDPIEIRLENIHLTLRSNEASAIHVRTATPAAA